MVCEGIIADSAGLSLIVPIAYENLNLVVREQVVGKEYGPIYPITISVLQHTVFY